MRPEKHLLIHDLLDDHQDPARRNAALLAGSRVLRHKRWRRAAIRVSACLALITAVVIPLYWPHHPPVEASAPPPRIPVRQLTDDQLLALFPNTPVGLATVNGRKVLVFPRPADQARFVGRF